MLKHPDLTLARLRKDRKDRLEPLIYPASALLDVAAWAVPGEPVPPEEALAADYEPFPVGGAWGPEWGTCWFRFSGRVPDAWKGRRVVARVALGYRSGEGFTAEGLVFEGGRPTRAVNVHRDEIPVSDSASGGEPVEFHVEAGANARSSEGAGPWDTRARYSGEPYFRLTRAELAVVDRAVWDLWIDMGLCLDAIACLPPNAPRRGQLLYALNAAWNRFDERDSESPARVREALRPIMSCRNGDTVHRISAVGHAHIDTAWLWPLRETIRKCARTFATQLRYMEQYPEYVFVCSQAVQYAWMKKHYPKIYAEIRAAVQRGQWEPVGSMWVESDCNIPSGESLVRQILHGKRFFMEEFGVETRDVWIPDVFGYSASFPQVMNSAGIRYFLTQKISWSQFNRFPHHTFHWQGIDGTRIFTHFPPADTYNANFTAQQLKHNEARFLEHDRATRSLYVYGYGDGGGGPTPLMLETARRVEDFEGLPQVTLERASAFFEKAEADAVDPPVWNGELYLELHRGTLTTHARNKRWNRQCEQLLGEAEWLDAVDFFLLGGSGRSDASIESEPPSLAVYESDPHPSGAARRGRAGALDRAWKLLLLNQFHDIIPGSSIGWVYQDCARDYAVIRTLGETARNDALAPILERVATGETEQPALVLNPLSVPCEAVVDGPGGGPVHVAAPAMGYAVQDLAGTGLPEGTDPVSVKREGDRIVVENGLLRVVLDPDGLIERLTDLRLHREVLAPGERGNALQVHPDYPHNWDAWDIDIFYREKVESLTELEACAVQEESPLRATVLLVRRYGESRIAQRMVLTAGSARLEFHTQVDWKARKRLLKVAFPVAVHAPRATYEIQFGHVERPTHYNTSWDMARFEVCGHRWADLSEGDYGVALLNDCKYGYDIHENVMRLSLLRGPESPDPTADLGEHAFSYALLPHSGDFRAGRVIEEAAALNAPPAVHPLERRTGGELPARISWFEVDRPGTMISAVKVAEEGDALVVRLYEAYGTRGPCTLTCRLPVRTVATVDLLEREEHSLELEAGRVTFTVRPFEIVTLKFRF